MNPQIMILLLEALIVYFAVLFAHSLRHRFGVVQYHALLGGLTAIMSWITDAGVRVEFAGITFMIGSTVFYTAILLIVFVIYVFDGPHETRNAIGTVVVISIITPVIAAILNLQMDIGHFETNVIIPQPGLRINTASVITTVLDMIFLAVAWEILGRDQWKLHLPFRAYITLLGVMVLDVILFNTLAFAGSPEFLSIARGTLVSRFVISIFAFPLLYGYLVLEGRKKSSGIVKRPILAIIRQVAEIRAELSEAQMEIEARKKAELERDQVIEDLKKALSEVKTLRGFIPICAHCKNIRDDKGYWNKIESYIRQHSNAEFSHGICPDCLEKYYSHLKKPDGFSETNPGV